ncbi:MAG: nucleotidyltransferase domain-containing protein [Verrucomicrobiota bacterium]|nr:nucleotidyltransferase domain-containing protein [Verrucomicrobiota bacterium]
MNKEIIKKETITRLTPLNPEKIILFGSYAYGKPDDNSDIDIFLIKEIPKNEVRNFRLAVRKRLRSWIFKNHLGVDIFADSQTRINERIEMVKDQFYQEIMQKGIVIYAK